MKELNQIKLVISDFHLSQGKWLKNGKKNPLEDFHQDEKFQELLEHYSSGKYEHLPVELIVNGDFFDPLAVIDLPDYKKSPPPQAFEYPLEVEEEGAITKFAKILEGHPVTISALKDFLAKGKRITFRWGNHDAALLWPGVQELIRKALNPSFSNQLTFQQEPYLFDRICIEHGNQYEILNQFNEKQMFLTRKTKTGTRVIQNLPFGSFFVLGFLNRVKLQRKFINRIYPLRLYIRISFFLEPVFFFTKGFAVAWFFIKTRFVTHPMRFSRLKKTFQLIGEIFHRSSLEDHAEKIFSQTADLPFDTLILGHSHQAAHRVFKGGKQYVNTGSWIPVTSLDMSNLGYHILRTYAVIEYFDQPQTPRISVKVWNGKPKIYDEFI